MAIKRLFLHPPRDTYGNLEDCYASAYKLHAIERLLQAAAAGHGERILDIVSDDDPLKTHPGEPMEDFLLGLGLIVRDLREELEMLAQSEGCLPQWPVDRDEATVKAGAR